MAISYEHDVAAWANEQAVLLRSGQLSQIDAENLATEIEGVGFWFEYELNERCGILLSLLGRWQKQEGGRCELWRRMIDLQRKKTNHMLESMPSLRRLVDDEGFLEDAWLEALQKEMGENSYMLSDSSPWTLAQALAPDFFPR